MSELCTLCQLVEAGPYCPEHGHVHRAFSIGGRYDVDELLGARSASFVFGAHDRTAARSVAIQVLRSPMTSAQVAELYAVQQRFVRETASLGTYVGEPSVGIVDFGWDDALGVTYLVVCQAGDPMVRPSLREVEAMLLNLDAASKANATIETVPDSLDMPAMIGSYHVIGALGAGGTGRVYLGQHPVIGSKVAIKVLLPEIAHSKDTVERFIQEARASSQIDSPHIPRYFDFGTTQDGLPYAIMEYFDGETLGKRLSRVGTISIAETAEILEQIASALLMAHAAGLVHRDLKPDNILLVHPDGKAGRILSGRATAIGPGGVKPAIEIKVLDFGIAKVVGNRSATQTLTGSFLGTPTYCAPEQVFGHPVDARTDVYSLGATAFQMLTGAPPFVGDVPEILSSKATEDPPDLRTAGVPTVVAQTIRKMLAREPVQRAPSMAWVLEQVARWPRSGEAASTARSGVAAPAARDDHERTADHRTLPAERTQPDGASHPARAGRAATPVAESSDELDPATTTQAVRTLAPLRGRARARTALMLTAGVLAAGALVALLGVPWSGSAAPAPLRPTVPVPATGRATARVVAPPRTPIDPQPDAPAAGPTGAPASAVIVEGTAAAAGDAPPDAHPPDRALIDPTGKDPRPGNAVGVATPRDPVSPIDGRASKSADEPAALGRAVPRHPGVKTSDKKPPTRKPPVKKPPPGDPKDVLIVDPFSHGNSSSRSASP